MPQSRRGRSASRPILRWSIQLSQSPPTLSRPARPLQRQRGLPKPIPAPAALPNQARLERMRQPVAAPNPAPRNPTLLWLRPPCQVHPRPESISPVQTGRDLTIRSQQTIGIGPLPPRRMVRSSLRQLLRRPPHVPRLPPHERPCRPLPPHRCRLVCRHRPRPVRPLLSSRQSLMPPRPARQLNQWRHVRLHLWRRRGRWPRARSRTHPSRRDPRWPSLASASRPLPVCVGRTPSRE